MILIQSWQEASKDAFAIRKQVFIEEQGVPEDLELDELDPVAIHALATMGSHSIGTGRLVHLEGRQAQIGRMAVLTDFRNQGIGTAILEKLIEQARLAGATNLILHAQVSTIPFYEKHGFEAQGEIYDEAGIAHRNMILLLPNES